MDYKVVPYKANPYQLQGIQQTQKTTQGTQNRDQLTFSL